MKLFFWVLALVPAALWSASEPVPQLASRIRQAGLDPEQCYRIREIDFSKDDVRIYLTSGYLILGKPIDGRRLYAVFSADVEGGDGEMLLLPPVRSERLSLATFTNSPNLSEHFLEAIMVFTDDTADELARLLEVRKSPRASPEMSLVLAQRWSSVVDNLADSFGNRILFDLIAPRPKTEGFFYTAFTGRRLGNFDLIYDPMAAEQLQVGQVAMRDNHPYFNVWTSFETRPFRSGQRTLTDISAPLSDYRIEATLERDLTLKVVTKATLTVRGANLGALFFDVTPDMEVSRVLLDGEPCEVWQRGSLRDDLLRGRGNGVFLVIPPHPVEMGHAYEMEFHHEGRVVSEAGNGVYYVGARGSWYPRQGIHFSNYDITFRYPEDVDMVFTGELLEDSHEDGWHVTRRRTESPIRLAGFNLGQYRHLKLERPGYTVEVYANQRLEQALEPEQKMMLVPRQGPWPSRPRAGAPEMVAVPVPTERPNPGRRLDPLANEVAEAFAFMSQHFGPPAIRTLTVSPIPGSFGQGFPGLLYLSTTAYLAPDERPAETRDEYHQTFFSEILYAHETAHQWWGHVVTAKGYQDEWLMEGLANYSALLLLERKNGPEALETALNQYRANLLATNGDGKTVESAGPICWGPRLDSSQTRAWRTVTYEKGSWIFHMLRRRMGDERFLAMLAELCRRYRFRTIDTEQFRQLAAEFQPEDSPDPELSNFFDQWVDGVGIPKLRFSQSVRGSPPRVRVSGNIAQSQVAEDFAIDVPIEFQLADGQSITRWIRTGHEPVPFDFTFPQRPARVVFNPGQSILTADE